MSIMNIKGEYILCSISQTWLQFSSVQLLSCVWLFVTLWAIACQASLSITNSQSSPKPTSIDIIFLDHPRIPAPSILYPVSNIDWRFVPYMIVYMFQCNSPKSSHPLPLQSPFCTSVSLLLPRIQGYHYHLAKFHIYVLVYCIGVFLSGLLHSV